MRCGVDGRISCGGWVDAVVVVVWDEWMWFCGRVDVMETKDVMIFTVVEMNDGMQCDNQAQDGDVAVELAGVCGLAMRARAVMRKHSPIWVWIGTYWPARVIVSISVKYSCWNRINSPISWSASIHKPLSTIHHYISHHIITYPSID